MLNWLVENWFLCVAAISVLVGLGFIIYKFFGLPTKDQVKKIKAWLLLAVTEAEAELGSGTGQLKLRFVYDRFITVPIFKVAAKFISFETFSKLVDDALDEMRELLEKNEAVRELIVK